MSTQKKTQAICPHCQHDSIEKIFISINAERSPHLRTALIDQTLHRIHCAQCEQYYTFDLQMNWVDFIKKEWVRVFPLSSRAQWASLMNASEQAYQQYLVGEAAPVMVHELGVGMKVRSVFGLVA